jgi:hypothetical protein
MRVNQGSVRRDGRPFDGKSCRERTSGGRPASVHSRRPEAVLLARSHAKRMVTFAAPWSCPDLHLLACQVPVPCNKVRHCRPDRRPQAPSASSQPVTSPLRVRCQSRCLVRIHAVSASQNTVRAWRRRAERSFGRRPRADEPLMWWKDTRDHRTSATREKIPRARRPTPSGTILVEVPPRTFPGRTSAT